MERRNLMGGGLAAGLTALVAGGEAEAAAAQGGDGTASQILVAQAVDRVRDAIQASQTRPWAPIQKIREQQRLWLLHGRSADMT